MRFTKNELLFIKHSLKFTMREDYGKIITLEEAKEIAKEKFLRRELTPFLYGEGEKEKQEAFYSINVKLKNFDQEFNNYAENIMNHRNHDHNYFLDLIKKIEGLQKDGNPSYEDFINNIGDYINDPIDINVFKQYFETDSKLVNEEGWYILDNFYILNAKNVLYSVINLVKRHYDNSINEKLTERLSDSLNSGIKIKIKKIGIFETKEEILMKNYNFSLLNKIPKNIEKKLKCNIKDVLTNFKARKNLIN